MDNTYREVCFDKYCKSCEHKNVNEAYEPCNECLDNSVRTHTDKPINWKEMKKISLGSKC